MIHGILNVNKETGYTSHDVVAKLRRILGQKKIGHTGTLDPNASGVLPICLGKATKLCELFTDKDKTYQARLCLGVETDTQDMTGEILRKKEVSCTEEEILHTFKKFLGKQEQIPPMYSAVKIKGKRLYELAREGKTVERTARKIEISSLVLQKIDLPYVDFEVVCSKGTYIRTLCADIGKNLSCGAAMFSLIRTRSGNFNLENSLYLTQIEDLWNKKSLFEHILLIEDSLKYYPSMIILPEMEKSLVNGERFRIQDFHLCRLAFCNENGEEEQATEQYPEYLCLYTVKKQLIGLYRYQANVQAYKIWKMLAEV
ncbi:tRNA pseudouridine synthase B [Clostridia bacterium]|nr:tRNA pseudouridine synthase B [Clostridia bacterium]